MPYNLILAEKPQQAEDIAFALGVPKKNLDVPIFTEEYSDDFFKWKKIKVSVKDQRQKIQDFETEYNNKSKPFAHLKSYIALKERLTELETKENTLLTKLNTKKPSLKTYKIDFHGNNQIVIIPCLGHLLQIGWEDRKRDDFISFDTYLKEPRSYESKGSIPTNYIRISLIEEYLFGDVDKIICATDFDREGQSIFGSIMDYEGIDPSICWRMKFSTLEANVLLNAYNNLTPFDIDFYNAGKMRRWMDFVIGMNLNPVLAQIYRGYIKDYLDNLAIDEETIKTCSITFNIGRVKNVIMRRIQEHTDEQTEIADQQENKEPEEEEEEVYELSYVDNSGLNVFLINNDSSLFEGKSVDFEEPFQVEITDVNYLEELTSNRNAITIPSFLNLTKVYSECKDLGSMDEINRVLEFLYLQKYISYPRSKSEKWEIAVNNDKIDYADSVLDALESIGYEIKPYYKGTAGNEGTETHSHPCIHPLPSLTQNKVDRLKKTNPLAYLIFHTICLYTLKCFEILPKAKTQKVSYKLSQGETEINFYHKFAIELIEPNILHFNGLRAWDTFLQKEVDVDEGDIFDVLTKKAIKIKTSIESNRGTFNMLTDYDIVNFLNENDVGTDATRTVLLKELIENQYIVSEKVILTTYLGNLLNKISSDYLNFMDIKYTLEMEKKLNAIEKGKLSIEDFQDFIKELVETSCNNLKAKEQEIWKVFGEVPTCEVHEDKMIIKNGKFGKFLLCPHFFISGDDCDQNCSI